MSNFSRRIFLKTTGGVVAASALSISPVSVFAQSATPPAVTVGYWNGSRFVAADQLPAGDQTLSFVKIGLNGFGSSGSLVGIEGHALMPVTSNEFLRLPFTAWVAPPVGCQNTQFVMTVNPTKGVLLSVQQRVSGTVQATDVSLLGNSPTGSKLREGTYIVLAGKVDLSTITFPTSKVVGPVIGVGAQAPSQYVLMTVVRD
jgi:hypothetical protein